MKNTFLAVLVAVVMGACAGPAREAEAPGATAQVCVRESPTGSSIAVTRCRTQAEIEQDRQAVEQVGRSVRGTTSPPGTAGTAGPAGR